MTYLRSGIFLAPFHDTRENPILALERDMELLHHLDALNYHEAWIGEHHSGGFEIIGSPEVFIAGAAERTKHIRLGTGVVSLPYHNPFILADRMVQLDYQTRGRAMMGVGPGSLVHDAKKIGINPAAHERVSGRHCGLVPWRDHHAQDRLVRPGRCEIAIAALYKAADGNGRRGVALAGRRSGGGPARDRHAVDRRHQR
jgi:hypothetical protein